jgi:hypothetical protein
LVPAIGELATRADGYDANSNRVGFKTRAWAINRTTMTWPEIGTLAFSISYAYDAL